MSKPLSDLTREELEEAVERTRSLFATLIPAIRVIVDSIISTYGPMVSQITDYIEQLEKDAPWLFEAPPGPVGEVKIHEHQWSDEVYMGADGREYRVCVNDCAANARNFLPEPDPRDEEDPTDPKPHAFEYGFADVTGTGPGNDRCAVCGHPRDDIEVHPTAEITVGDYPNQHAFVGDALIGSSCVWCGHPRGHSIHTEHRCFGCGDDRREGAHGPGACV